MNSLDADLMAMLGMSDDSKSVWVMEFDGPSAKQFYTQFMKLERDDEVRIIPVFISSYGGEIYALTAMRDLIKSSHKPVATIAVGMAMSCGASLLAAGSKGYRFASPDTQILIHQASGFAPGKASELEEFAKVMKDLNNTMFKNLAKDTGRDIEEFEKEIHRRKNVDWTLKASAAKRWGLIDHIGIPRPQNHPPMMFIGNNESYDSKIAMETAAKAAKRPKKSSKKKGARRA
jgi:ATP-dependent Clp protease, protease subunit